MSADRLEGVMRLTPALGQQKLYVLVFTTDKDLQQTTTLLDPAKAYAKGVGNAIPDIPDPIARHTTDGLLKLKSKPAPPPACWSGRCLAHPALALSRWVIPQRLRWPMRLRLPR